MTNSLDHYKRLIAVEVDLIETPGDIDAWTDLCSALSRYHADWPHDPLRLAGNLGHHVRSLLAADAAKSIIE